jgi:hypothetical protein
MSATIAIPSPVPAFAPLTNVASNRPIFVFSTLSYTNTAAELNSPPDTMKRRKEERKF